MFRLIIDTQLPPSLAEFFRRRGIDATHVVNYPLGALTQDDEIISIATNERRIIVTKDFDFFDYYMLKNFPPAILLLQFGNIKNSELFILVDNHLDTIRKVFADSIERLVIINHYKLVVY